MKLHAGIYLHVDLLRSQENKAVAVVFGVFAFYPRVGDHYLPVQCNRQGVIIDLVNEEGHTVELKIHRVFVVQLQ